VQKAVEGHTATVFAYGQTGAGKTHSMLGPADCMTQLADDEVIDASGRLPDSCRELIDNARRAKVCGQGVLPRSVQFVFRMLLERSPKGDSQPTVQITFMEIYNEKVFDLLNPSGIELQVRQKPSDQGFHVPELTSLRCTEPGEALEALRRGAVARHTSGHSGSRDSSRAHAIFSMEFECGGGRQGKLVFADLAGSERTKRIRGNDQTESANINKSLLMLSNCVSALAQQSVSNEASSSSSSTPSMASSSFRNSKLTKVLMESLCGNSFTLLIATVSPAKRHFDETANTLFFAAKCANIRKEQVAVLTPQERQLEDLRETVNQLRRQLAEAQAQAATAAPGPYPSLDGTGDADASLDLVRALRQELLAERRRSAELQRQLDALRRQVRDTQDPTGGGEMPGSDPNPAG